MARPGHGNGGMAGPGGHAVSDRLPEIRVQLEAADSRLELQEGEGTIVSVPLGTRHHMVRLAPDDEWLCVWAKAIRPEALDPPPSTAHLAAQLLQANHHAELAQIALAADGWLEVRYELPMEAAPVSEVVAAIWRVARLADRWELLWTGVDVL